MSSCTLTCCDVYGNAGGNYVDCIAAQQGISGNISEDPLFCGSANPAEPYSLRDDSPCAAPNNPGCGQIGAYGVGCAGGWTEPPRMFLEFADGSNYAEPPAPGMLLDVYLGVEGFPAGEGLLGVTLRLDGSFQGILLSTTCLLPGCLYFGDPEGDGIALVSPECVVPDPDGVVMVAMFTYLCMDPPGTPGTLELNGHLVDGRALIDCSQTDREWCVRSDPSGHCGVWAPPPPGDCTAPPDIEVDPSSIEFTIEGEPTDCQGLTISNVGGLALSWLVGDESARLEFPDGRVAPVRLEATVGEAPLGDLGADAHHEDTKDEPDPGRGAPMLRGSGGPDAYGYTWIDSDDPGGPAFDWQDIQAVGTPLTLGDDDYVDVALPFAFIFYGVPKYSLKICSNGYLTFGSDGMDYTNDPIPDVIDPNDFIAPFWDDLNPVDGGTVHYYHDAMDDAFIVQYTGVPHYSGAGTTGLYTFQVIIRPDGGILYQYLEMIGTLDSATIGIENAPETDGLQVVYNAAYVHDDLAVKITPPCWWLAATPDTGVVAPGGEATIAVCVDSEWLSPGVYECNLVIASNDPDEPVVVVPVTLTVIWTGIEDDEVAGRLTLRGNYPNPFNPATTIAYDLPSATTVTLSVYDITGRHIRTLLDGASLEAGRHEVPWDGRDAAGRDVASGVYFYRLEAAGESITRKMILVK